jgi:hypothetical protein
MRRSLPFLSLFTGLLSLSLVAQTQSDRFAYAVTDVVAEGANWSFLRKINLQTGSYSDVILNGNEMNRLNYDAATKKQFTTLLQDARFGPLANAAFGTGVAAAAYDRKNNRLYYTPMLIDQLRYIDLRTMNVYFVTGDFTGLTQKAADQSNIITRMVIADDGNGYALTNDARHLVRFTTGKTLAVTDLGTLADAQDNAMSIHSSCSSFGGDMIADDDGNLLVLSARNNVFKVNIESKVATHVGTITEIPANFTTNGAAVDHNNEVLITSAVDASDIYTLDINSLVAKPVKAKGTWRTADLANSNLLRTRKPTALPELISEADPLGNDRIQLYPNPVTSNQFNVQFTNIEAGTYTIQVTDARGQLAAQKTANLIGKGGITSVNLSETAAKGIYVVKISDHNSKTVFSRKIVIQ